MYKAVCNFKKLIYFILVIIWAIVLRSNALVLPEQDIALIYALAKITVFCSRLAVNADRSLSIKSGLKLCNKENNSCAKALNVHAQRIRINLNVYPICVSVVKHWRGDIMKV